MSWGFGFVRIRYFVEKRLQKEPRMDVISWIRGPKPPPEHRKGTVIWQVRGLGCILGQVLVSSTCFGAQIYHSKALFSMSFMLFFDVFHFALSFGWVCHDFLAFRTHEIAFSSRRNINFPPNDFLAYSMDLMETWPPKACVSRAWSASKS